MEGVLLISYIKSLSFPSFFGTFYLTYNLYTEVIIIYTDIDDIYTVKNVDFFEEPYCYISIDMLEIDIKNIWTSLGTIIGETYSEELIDEMFSRFCLGK